MATRTISTTNRRRPITRKTTASVVREMRFSLASSPLGRGDERREARGVADGCSETLGTGTEVVMGNWVDEGQTLTLLEFVEQDSLMRNRDKYSSSDEVSSLDTVR